MLLLGIVFTYITVVRFRSLTIIAYQSSEGRYSGAHFNFFFFFLSIDRVLSFFSSSRCLGITLAILYCSTFTLQQLRGGEFQLQREQIKRVEKCFYFFFFFTSNSIPSCERIRIHTHLFIFYCFLVLVINQFLRPLHFFPNISNLIDCNNFFSIFIIKRNPRFFKDDFMGVGIFEGPRD